MMPSTAQTLVMGEQHSWPDDLALGSLRRAAAALVALDTTPARDDLPRAVERALRALWRAIEGCEEAGIDKREILAHLGDARAIHARSPFIARAQTWPRGYPGDFETIEYLCAAENRASPGTVPHALEECALPSAITAQHRNKVAFQADAILAACRRTDGRARILSVGCGGCRDIRSIANALLPTSAEFVLCDIDYEALDFSLHALGPLAGRCTYLNATVRRVLRRLAPFGPFDLAIAGGVFDYLPDRWVILSARTIWQTLLAPKRLARVHEHHARQPFPRLAGVPRELGADRARRTRCPGVLYRERNPTVVRTYRTRSHGTRASRYVPAG
jgi:hypothetical protein